MASMAGLALSVGSSLFAAGESSIQSEYNKQQAKVNVKQEELAATSREADRKERLASAMAAQNALSGVSGIAAYEGSPLTILEDSIRREQRATQRDVFQTNLTRLGIRGTARARARMASSQQGLSMFQTAYGISQSGLFAGTEG